MNFLNRTAITIPILFSLIGIFSFLLYRNLTKKVEGGDNPVIGVLSFKTKTIQRKFDGQVVWESIPTETEIKNRDTIRTENLADAILTLEDGTKIQVGENSMIIVDFSDKKWNLNFAYGSVAAQTGTGDAGNSLSINVDGSEIAMTSGDMSLNKSGDKLDVNVKEGDVKLRVDGKEESLQENQTASVSKEGVDVKKTNIRLVEPSDRIVMLTDTPQKNISFSWTKPSSPIRDLSLVLSTDVGFRRIVSRSRVTGQGFQVSLKPGVYYWKIQYKDPEGKNSESSVSRFNLILKEGIKLFSPTNNQNIAILPNSPKPVSFSWSKSDIVGSYRVEIATSSDFSNIIQSKETKNSSISFMNIEEGEYYYRVIGRSLIQGDSNLESSIRRFRLSKQKDLVKPSLLSPVNQKSISLASTGNRGVFFSWRDSGGYVKYRYQLSPSIEFNNLKINQETDKNFFKWTQGLESGNYYWRVIGISANGDSKTSDIYELKVSETIKLALIQPRNASKIPFPDDGRINFAWKKFPSSGQAKLMISQSNSFQSNVLEERITGNSKIFRLPRPGLYYWRIVWEAGNNRSISDSFSFTLESSLKPPAISFPRTGSTVDMTKKEDIFIQWSRVQEADLYNLRLLDTTGLREREILNIRLKSNSFRFKDLTKLNQGKFVVEVRALKKNRDNTYTDSPSAKSEFFITLTSGITTKILTPERIYVE